MNCRYADPVQSVRGCFCSAPSLSHFSCVLLWVQKRWLELAGESKDLVCVFFPVQHLPLKVCKQVHFLTSSGLYNNSFRMNCSEYFISKMCTWRSPSFVQLSLFILLFSRHKNSLSGLFLFYFFTNIKQCAIIYVFPKDLYSILIESVGFPINKHI